MVAAGVVEPAGVVAPVAFEEVDGPRTITARAVQALSVDVTTRWTPPENLVVVEVVLPVTVVVVTG